MAASDAPSDRLEPRYLTRDAPTVTVTMEPKDFQRERKVVQARLVNLSEHGVRLCSPTPLPVQAAVRLELRIRELALQMYVAAHVCWCEAAGDNQWQAGCALSPGIPAAWFDQLARSSCLDRRALHRHTETLEFHMRRKLRWGYETVTVRDCSLGGFCIETTKPAAPGTAVHLYLEEPERRMIVAVSQWQLKTGGGYLLGCKLADANDSARFREAVLLGCNA